MFKIFFFLLIIFFFQENFIAPLWAMEMEGLSSDSLTNSLDDKELSSDSLTVLSEVEDSDNFLHINRLIATENTAIDALHIFIFKVKQGNFCMIRKGDSAIIIDAGSYCFKGKDFIEFTKIKKFFEISLRQAKIKVVIITHTDEDHCNFLDSLNSYMDTACFFIVGGTEDHNNVVLEKVSPKKYESYWLDISSSPLMFKNKNKFGNYFFFDILVIENKLNSLISKVNFQFLTPIQIISNASIKNDYSLVFKFTLGGNSILFTGDATANTYNIYFPRVAPIEKIEIKKRNIHILKGVNLFMLPHHGSDTCNSSIWTDIIIKYNQNTLVGAIASVGLDSPFGHPVSFVYDKPWPPSMQTEKSYVMAQWKQSKSKYKKTSKNMHARILETWNSFGFFDFVFTNNGNLWLLKLDDEGYFFWENLIANNVPFNFHNVVQSFYKKDKKELTDIDKFALRFLPDMIRQKILNHFDGTFNHISEDSSDISGDSSDDDFLELNHEE